MLIDAIPAHGRHDMDHFLISYEGTFQGRRYGPETRERDIPTTEGAARASLEAGIMEHPGVTSVKVLHLEGNTGRFHDVTEAMVDAIRREAFDDEARYLLEHPVIHPQGFCFDCYKASGQCIGCSADHAYEVAAE